MTALLVAAVALSGAYSLYLINKEKIDAYVELAEDIQDA